MRIFPYISLIYSSPLAPAEIVRRVQSSTLPLANASWRDDFRIDPSQPFQGVIADNSFEIVRLSVSKVRQATPPKIKGWMSPIPDGGGSEIRIRYYNPAMLRLIVGSGVMAAGLAVASMIQDWKRMGAVNPLGLAYMVLPVCAVVAQYFQLKNELNTVQPILNRLLVLEESAL
ncbi:hypothetical protein Q3A66_09270 [Hymenobacter sp. BT770]|uniref:hypothetical protein n=1 Tax=Hymenobacter sp. BT770 TaxID=2886942 RepID=UPI001D0FF148|nr:hypothetical protein [Hymenobacter sp. BT770]MCC3152061.1 hypothetical protein [Hymenobacter sp. BT770]MDO3415256.1 hypothetical protein [Hymenobacter sp. BT770]